MAERDYFLTGPSGFLASRWRVGLVAAVLALLGLGVRPAAAINFGEIEIVVPSEPQGHPGHGYTEYRLLVRHRGKETTHRVTLTVPGHDISVGRGGFMQAVSRTVDIDPGKALVVPLWVPANPMMFDRDVAVRIDGRLQRDRVALTTVSGGRGRQDRLILLSRTVPNDLLHPPARLMPGIRPEAFPGAGGMGGGPPGMMPGAPGGAAGRGGVAPGAAGPPVGLPPGMVFMAPFTFNGQPIHASTPISTWSSHWLAYTRWDGIIVTREDLADLARGGNETVAIQQALWQYVEAGGSLLVLGPGAVEVPAGWRRFQGERHGLTEYMSGFGRCLVSPERASANWSRDRWGVIEGSWNTTSQPWHSPAHMAALNESFPVIDDLGVPVKGLFVLMVLFTILIGPLNLLWLNKHNRRIWMLWTVPVVSFFTCLAVFGYMIVAEGWQGHSRLVGLTLLDEVEKRATTLGRATFYSPLTPSDGLRFSTETEVFPLGPEHSVFSSACTLDWSDGQHLARGWVSARVPAHFMLRKSEPRRESIKVHREGNALVLVNRLGTDIHAITLADEKGRLHEGANIKAGEKGTLTRTNREAKPQPNAWRVFYSSSNWVSGIKSAAGHPQEFLRPRTYLAEIEGSPFLEQGLKGAKERESLPPKDPNVSLVLGLMADLE